MSLDVLVVEDDADIREIVCSILTDKGHSVRESPNGEEALAFLRGRAPSDRPYLILVDMFMPKMGGAELVEAMQHTDVLASIPVALMTGSGNGVAQRAASAPNVVRVLPKPFNLSALLALVDEYCPGASRPTAAPPA